MPKILPLDTANQSDLDPFSQVRLIVADLDGTLLDPEKSVIDYIRKSIPRLKNRGVGFTIATGRALKGVADVLPQLGLTASMPIALYNGSLCIDAAQKNILYSRVIPSAVAKKAVDWGLSHGMPVLCYPQLSQCSDGFQEAPMGFSPDGMPPLAPEPNGYDIKWLTSQSTASIPDCLAILIDLRESGGMPTQQENYSLPDVTMTQSGSGFIEIRPSGSDKGGAITAIAQRRNIPLSAVLAIGDNDNDIEMLKIAGVSVAVGNASKNILSVAGYSTPRNAAKGCLQVIRLVLAAKRYQRAPEKRS